MSYLKCFMVEVDRAMENSVKNRPIVGTVTPRALQAWVSHAGVALVLIANSFTGCSEKRATMPGALADATGEVAGDARREALPCAEPAPTFAAIQKLFDQNCVSCHVAGSGLDLTAGQSYANLLGQAPQASESCGGILVVPGSPDTSYLYAKVSNPHPCSGLQMPRTDIYSIPLPECLQQLVRDWITAGALFEGNVSDAGSMMDSAVDGRGQ